MGYDRQTSPFATRLFLTCYCLFLLVNVLLYSNDVYRLKNTKYNYEIISLGFINILIFSLNLYGLWFARIVILCFIVLLFFILLGTSLISLILLITNVLSINLDIFYSLKTSLYFAHNYLWLKVVSTHSLSIISLSMSCILNIFALWCTCHLCSCIEHRQPSWPYRRRIQRCSQTII